MLYGETNARLYLVSCSTTKGSLSMLGLPALHGLVRRRILVNYRVDPDIVARQLPAPFRPKLVNGWAVAGICLIRLEELRPKGTPAFLGLSSENAAHRVAVTWTDDAGIARQGVYIPRRDTGALLPYLAGGRLFPGEPHPARLHVRDEAGTLRLVMATEDGAADVRLVARAGETIPSTSVFDSLDDASHFFAGGSVGYSARRTAPGVDGLQLRTRSWSIGILDAERVSSRYFEDTGRFPHGSVAYDSTFVMRDIPHEWRPLPDPATPLYLASEPIVLPRDEIKTKK
jgi:hypothetical protein